ncbi:MAG: hypothetical protein QHJ73_08925, partial [Armatimonadota bacterium]|nr:hypothetical protein [Armatimonadota bacterium]
MENKQEVETRQRCRAITRAAGAQCRNWAVAGSEYCTQHLKLRAKSEPAKGPAKKSAAGETAGQGDAPAAPAKRSVSAGELRSMQKKLQALLSDATPYEAHLLRADLEVLSLAIEAADAGAHVS